MQIVNIVMPDIETCPESHELSCTLGLQLNWMTSRLNHT